jgi:hypothetical protein
VAAELTGRQRCGLELDPKYVDVIIERWHQVTRLEACLDGHDLTFQQVQSERLGESAAMQNPPETADLNRERELEDHERAA